MANLWPAFTTPIHFIRPREQHHVTTYTGRQIINEQPCPVLCTKGD